MKFERFMANMLMLIKKYERKKDWNEGTANRMLLLSLLLLGCKVSDGNSVKFNMFSTLSIKTQKDLQKASIFGSWKWL